MLKDYFADGGSGVRTVSSQLEGCGFDSRLVGLLIKELDSSDGSVQEHKLFHNM